MARRIKKALFLLCLGGIAFLVIEIEIVSKQDTITTRIHNPLDVLPTCKDFVNSYYGLTPINHNVPSWKFLEQTTPNLQPGGHFKPKDCLTKHNVAIIIPYRNRTEHLRIFLQHMHPFLQRQKIEYTVFVIELVTGIMFNRGALMNIGFLEASNSTNIDCFIFHDVDMLPMHTGISYTCDEKTVKHLTRYVRQYNFKLNYKDYIGGALAFPKMLYKRVNGYPNIYWGWGGEDDDLYRRIRNASIKVKGTSNQNLSFWSWSHNREPQLVNRGQYWKGSVARMSIDGLNSCKYKVLEVEKRPLYTWFYISINQTDHQIKGVKPVYRPNSRREVPNIKLR